MTHNGERRPDEIEAEIERTRADMDATLSAIESRLTPGQLVDQGLDYLRHSGGNEFLSNLRSSVKQNPLPVTLVGLGVAWLMMGGRPVGEAPPTSLRDRGEEAKERLSDAAAAAGDKLGSTARTARENVSHAATAVRERASQLGATTQRQWQRARGSYGQLLDEQPLVLGAAGLAVGALLAAALPKTRAETALLGERDKEAPDLAASRATASTAQMGAEQRASMATEPGADFIPESGRVACPATDAPVEQPIHRGSSGMDV